MPIMCRSELYKDGHETRPGDDDLTSAKHRNRGRSWPGGGVVTGRNNQTFYTLLLNILPAGPARPELFIAG